VRQGACHFPGALNRLEITGLLSLDQVCTYLPIWVLAACLEAK
jgi:hypothetical protein